MRAPKRFTISKYLLRLRAMLDASFSHLYFFQRLPTLQRGLSEIANLLVLRGVGSQQPRSGLWSNVYSRP